MRVSDADIIMVPGWGNSGSDHWQTRWEAKLSTARRVRQRDWMHPNRDEWVKALVAEVEASTRPAVLVAHSVAVPTVAHAAPLFTPGKVIGAFLVAPTDETAIRSIPDMDDAFAPIPREPLPFPSLLVASRNDPYCEFAFAEDLAYCWGSAFADHGDAGHINSASGHGPWPEGLMRFAGFLSRLKAIA
jgi:hypothetical protein